MTVGAIALTLLVMVPAQAQEESPAVTTSVLGTSTTVPETTTTTVADTTTTEAEVIATTTTTAEAPAVAGVTTRRLPITGGDIGGAAVVGLALTGAGIALAYGARRRRVHAESA